VREGEPSRTAFGAAVLRALHPELDEPVVFDDPLAWRILGDSDQILAALDDRQERSRLRVFIAVRHRFAEDGLAAAYERGTRQAVVLGAGFDTAAYRNPHPDLRFWEADHPATGNWKRERLREAAIDVPATVRFVGIDFETESFLDRLVEAGFDEAAPAFFLWLGVVPYLTREATAATLSDIASIPGGEVVFDMPAPSDQVPGEAQADRAELEARVADLGEPFRGGWDIADMLALLAELGFDDVEDLDRSAIRTRYLRLPPGRDRPGGAHVVRARRSV
jgi:methyltransferase (TIGR00027 family)